MSNDSGSNRHPRDWLFVLVFIPLWLGALTFFADAVLGLGLWGIPGAIFCTVATLAGGDAYEWIRDRKYMKRFKDDDQVWLAARIIVYLAVVPLFPMLVIYALRAIGSPGLEWINLNGAWSGGEGVAIMFAFFRINPHMPLSFGRLFGPPR